MSRPPIDLFRRSVLASAIAGLAFSPSEPVVANPSGAEVIRGNVDFQTFGNELTITNSNGAIVHWQDFSIAQDEITRFQQETANSAVLNRVVGGNVSEILGQLVSNGQVFLINPNGVVFGQSVTIDTAGFVASTLDLANEDFLTGDYVFEDGGNAGRIVNEGYLTTRGGNVFFVAADIENSGVVHTEDGSLVLAAGERVRIRSLDTPDIEFEVASPENEIVNLGSLLADQGAVKAFAGTLTHSGEVRADSVVVAGDGSIVLFAEDALTLEAGSVVAASGDAGGDVLVQSEAGTVLAGGSIEAEGANGAGGRIRLLGEQVGVIEQAIVSADGTSGGGEILIGGNLKGLGPEPNADAVFVGAQTNVTASATEAGDGGTVIAFGENQLRLQGVLSAHGGPGGGDGGFVETSALRGLQISAVPDVSGPAGDGGHWLIDPEGIRIVPDGTATPPEAVDEYGGGIFTPADPFGLDTNELEVGLIDAALSGGATVAVDTRDRATVYGGIVWDATLTLDLAGNASGNTLELLASDDVVFTGNARILDAAGALTALNIEAPNGAVLEDGALLDVPLTMVEVADSLALNTFGQLELRGGRLTAQSLFVPTITVSEDPATPMAVSVLDVGSPTSVQNLVVGDGTVLDLASSQLEVFDTLSMIGTLRSGTLSFTGTGNVFSAPMGAPTLDGTEFVLDGGTIGIAEDIAFLNGAIFRNDGTLGFTGEAALQGDGSLVNEVTGVITLFASTASGDALTTLPSLDNRGTLVLNSDGGPASARLFVDGAFTSSGTLRVQNAGPAGRIEGALELTAGAFEIQSDVTLDPGASGDGIVLGGTSLTTLGPGATATAILRDEAPDLILADDATLDLPCMVGACGLFFDNLTDANSGRFVLQGGTIQGMGGVDVTEAELSVDGGTATITGAVSAGSVRVLESSALTLSGGGNLGSTGAVRISGDLTVDAATLTAGGPLELQGSEDDASLTITGTTVDVANGGFADTAVIDLQPSGGIDFSSGLFSFRDASEIRGTGSLDFAGAPIEVTATASPFVLNVRVDERDLDLLGTGNLVIQNQVTLNGANSFGGSLLVDGGFLRLVNDFTSGPASLTVGGFTTNNEGTLEFSSNTEGPGFGSNLTVLDTPAIFDGASVNAFGDAHAIDAPGGGVRFQNSALLRVNGRLTIDGGAANIAFENSSIDLDFDDLSVTTTGALTITGTDLTIDDASASFAGGTMAVVDSSFQVQGLEGGSLSFDGPLSFGTDTTVLLDPDSGLEADDLAITGGGVLIDGGRLILSNLTVAGGDTQTSPGDADIFSSAEVAGSIVNDGGSLTLFEVLAGDLSQNAGTTLFLGEASLGGATVSGGTVEIDVEGFLAVDAETIVDGGALDVIGPLTTAALEVSAGSVLFDGPSSLDVVAVSGGLATFQDGFDGNATQLTISGGVAELEGASDLATLTLTGGTLAGSGLVSVIGTANFAGGAMSGTGTTEVPAGTVLAPIFDLGLEGDRVFQLDGDRAFDSFTLRSMGGFSYEFENTFTIAPPTDFQPSFVLENIDATNSGTLRLESAAATPLRAEIRGGSFFNEGTIEALHTVSNDEDGFAFGPSGLLRFEGSALTNTGNLSARDVSVQITDSSADFTPTGALSVLSTSSSSTASGSLGTACCGLLAFNNNSTGRIAGTVDLSYLDVSRGTDLLLETDLTLSGFEVSTFTFTSQPVPPAASSVIRGAADIEVLDSFFLIGGNLALDGTVTLREDSRFYVGLNGPESEFFSIDFPSRISGTTLRNESNGQPGSLFRNVINSDLMLDAGARFENLGTVFVDSTYADRAASDAALERSSPVMTRAPVLVGFSGDGSGTIRNEGRFEGTGGTPFEIGEVSFENLGTVDASALTLASSGTLLNQGAVDVAGRFDAFGTIELADGTIAAAPLALGSTGVLSGNGTVVGLLENGGLVTPGTSPGAINVDGDFVQTSAGRLFIEIDGTAAAAGTDFDALVITGNATFGGTLGLETLDAFAGTLGGSFIPIRYGSATGSFATVQQPTNADVVFDPAFGPEGLVATISALNGELLDPVDPVPPPEPEPEPNGPIDPANPPRPENEQQARDFAGQVLAACPDQREEVRPDNNTQRERENPKGDPEGLDGRVAGGDSAPAGTQGVGCVTR